MNVVVENLLLDDVAAETGVDNALDAPTESTSETESSSTSISTVPYFDTVAHCRQVSEVGGTGSYTIEETCRNMEADARQEIAARSIPGRVYDHCKQVAEVSGPGSYTIFKTCVEMELGAAGRL